MAKAAVSNDQHFMFWCPGCDEPHGFPIDGSRGWSFSGTLESPTIRPSIKVTTNLYGPDKLMFSKYKGPMPCELTEGCCHSFISKGRIEFCSDSTHALSGQTVDLPDWE